MMSRINDPLREQRFRLACEWAERPISVRFTHLDGRAFLVNLPERTIQGAGSSPANALIKTLE
jgi:hypothetical protein